MADHFYGVPLPVDGAGDFGAVVTIGTSTGGNTTSALELRIHDGLVANNRQQILLGLEMIRAAIINSHNTIA